MVISTEYNAVRLCLELITEILNIEPAKQLIKKSAFCAYYIAVFLGFYVKSQ